MKPPEQQLILSPQPKLQLSIYLSRSGATYHVLEGRDDTHISCLDMRLSAGWLRGASCSALLAIGTQLRAAGSPGAHTPCWCVCGKRSDLAKHVPPQLSQPRALASRPRRLSLAASDNVEPAGHHGAVTPLSITSSRRCAAAHTSLPQPNANTPHLAPRLCDRPIHPLSHPTCSRRCRVPP